MNATRVLATVVACATLGLHSATLQFASVSFASADPVSFDTTLCSLPMEFSTAPAVNCNWTTPPFESFSTSGRPADPIGAAGPDHIVSVVNSQIGWHTKDGASQCRQSLLDFFDPLNPASVPFDPRVVYDHYAGRFVVTAVIRYSLNSSLLLAVSDDDDPNGGWYYQAIDSKVHLAGEDSWSDYPQLALDEEALYITANMFSFSETDYTGSRLWIIGKSPLYSGGQSTHAVYDPAGATGVPESKMAPTLMFGEASTGVGTYLVRYSGFTATGQEYLSIIRVDNPLGTPSFTHEWILCGDIDSPGLLDTRLPDAPQSGTSKKIDAGDRRVHSAVWRDDALYAVACVKAYGGVDDGQVTVHWWQVSTLDPGDWVLTMQGNIGGEDIATGTHTYYPAIMADQDGNLGMSFSASGPSVFPGAYYALRLISDLPNAFGPSEILAAGQDYYSFAQGDDRNRWGDYSGIALDPADNTTFWVYNMFADSRDQTAPDDSSGRYRTKWASFGHEESVTAFPGEGLVTLQDAIDVTPAGSIVEVDGDRVNEGAPAGPITMKPGIRLRAKPGTPRPVINATGASTAVSFPGDATPYTEISGFVIKGFTVTGVRQWDPVPSEYMSVTVTDCDIQGGSYGIWAYRGHVKISGCTITNAGGYGIVIEDGVCETCLPSTVKNNLIVSTTSSGDGISILPFNRPIEIANNTIVGWGRGIRFATAGNPPAFSIRQNIIAENSTGLDCGYMGMIVECNDVYGNTTGYLDCLGADLIDNIAEDPLFCDGSGPEVGTHTLRIDSPCAPEQAASCGLIGAKGIECAWGVLTQDTAVPSGANIAVLADLQVPIGLNLTLQPGATLRFEPTRDLIVSGDLTAGELGQDPVIFTSRADSPSPSDWGMIQFLGGATVQMKNAVIEYADWGVHYTADDPSNRFEAVTFRYNGTDAVRVDEHIDGPDGPAGRFVDCTFEVSGAYGARVHYGAQELRFEDCTFLGSSVALAGIAFINSGSTVSGGRISGFSMGSGIDASSSVNPTIQGVTLDSNLYGLQWRNSAGGLIESCTFNKGTSQPTDIWVRNTAGPTIRTCTFNANPNTGIQTEDQSAPVIGPDNTILARNLGVFAKGTSAPRIRGNTITGCYIGVRSASTAQPDVGTVADYGNNSISGSTYRHVDGGKGHILPAEKNWWGQAPPDPTKFSANVDFDPWLTGQPAAVGYWELAEVGGSISLVQGAFPNPMLEGTRFQFVVPEGQEGRVEVFDLAGRLLQSLDLPGFGSGGVAMVSWDGMDQSGQQVASGAYWYRFRAGSQTITGRLTVVR